MIPERMAQIHREASGPMRPWSVREFKDIVSHPLTLVCTQQDDCFVVGRVVVDEAEILMIATAPDQQRKGLAGACLDTFLNAAAQQGAIRVFLEVDATNSAALALYHSRGFEQSGLRKRYYEHPDGTRSDAIGMTKILTI